MASTLPNFDNMIQLLNEKKPPEAHLDEIFPRFITHCVLVIKDVYSRILGTEAVDKRDEDTVKPFLERFKKLGLVFQAFYTDGCKAYFNAIRATFGEKIEILYDYFHIIQKSKRHLWKWAVAHRRQIKELELQSHNAVVIEPN